MPARLAATAVELLARLARSGNTHRIERFLIEWNWAAELLESHLSFPCSAITARSMTINVAGGADDVLDTLPCYW